MLYLLLLQRVELFRERVTSDKKALGIIRPGDLPSPSTYITIHRPRLLEDGHEQLATLTTKSLKSTIRVKFFNEQVGRRGVVGREGVWLGEWVRRVGSNTSSCLEAG